MVPLEPSLCAGFSWETCGGALSDSAPWSANPGAVWKTVPPVRPVTTATASASFMCALRNWQAGASTSRATERYREYGAPGEVARRSAPRPSLARGTASALPRSGVRRRCASPSNSLVSLVGSSNLRGTQRPGSNRSSQAEQEILARPERLLGAPRLVPRWREGPPPRSRAPASGAAARRRRTRWFHWSGIRIFAAPGDRRRTRTPELNGGNWRARRDSNSRPPGS